MAKLLAIVLALGIACAAEDGGRKALRHDPPTYPALAKQMNVWGTVKLELTVAPDGHVADVKTIGGHPLLIDSAVKAVKAWTYAPATQETTERVAIQFNNQ
jgi:TonB family protein